MREEQALSQFRNLMHILHELGWERAVLTQAVWCGNTVR